MTSTRGTLPFLYVRLGSKRVIQPSTGGLSWFSSISIVFWPGAILTGPYLKRSVWTPLCAEAGAAATRRTRTAASATRTRMIMTRCQW